MTDAVEYAVRCLTSLHDNDVQEMQGGGCLIGRNPPRTDGLFEQGYRHEIYSPLDESKILLLEQLSGKRIPDDLKDFYRQANGLSFFCGSLSIGGLRTDYTRDMGSYQPVSLEYGNRLELPQTGNDLDTPHREQIKFGFYAGGDGAELAMSLDGDRRIFLLPRRRTAPILFCWSNLKDFLQSEVSRLAAAYLQRGGEVSPIDVLPLPTAAA